ncbi:hypothetical protein KIW84_044680 [Lathyrus oleraceus]|uniref:Uncharacterized protein n=1 Tax=Pisum sativum TaxID=3888 RepID=A0A9D4XL61_PEA|nr:hypothetical protein KIW84_044680 [Pisum sativum]
MYERMMDLTVEIGGNIETLEEALGQFTTPEILDKDNKYNCGRCKSYEKAKKKLPILEASNIRSIALKQFKSEHPATIPEFNHPVAEESFESGEFPQGQNEDVSEAQNDNEISVGKDEESKDPLHLDGTSQDELQVDKTGISVENLDQPGQTKMMSDAVQKDHSEIDNQQSTLRLSSWRACI